MSCLPQTFEWGVQESKGRAPSGQAFQSQTAMGSAVCKPLAAQLVPQASLEG